MKHMLMATVLVICLALAGLPAAVSAAEELELEPLPSYLKEPYEGAVYEDEKFFSIADPAIKSLSNRTVPIGSQRMSVQSAYNSLRNLQVSPENYDKAQDAFAYLYYSGKAGESYENFFDAKKSVAAMTDGSEYYDQAQIYYDTAAAWWALIADQYPKVTMYTLPRKDEPYPGDDAALGTMLEGLKYPLILAQKTPDTSKPFEDEKVKTTITRWIEDNIDAIPNSSDLSDVSQGGYFIMGDDLKTAKSTYIGLSTKNVDPEFYDTANYINAFLYYLSLARENFDEFVAQRRSLMQATDGEDSYDKAKLYYDEARVALSLFRDKVEGVNAAATLPEFPRIDEVEKGRLTEQEQLLSDSWGGTSWK